MQGQKIIRAVLFVLFFGVGVASLSCAIICEDLAQYYQNKHLLNQSEESLKRLQSLNTEYDVILEKWKQDPNLVVQRVARATLGPNALPEPEDPNTAYPRASAQLLAAARKVLNEDKNPSLAEQAEPPMPRWLVRCRLRPSRITLFACGVILILTSFVCFRPEKELQR
jgi:cell division protein FtsL